MMWLFIVLLMIFLFSRLESFLDNTRQDVSQTIGEMVLASRFPSGRLTIQEMEQQDIYPYFCYGEYRIVWVEHPSDNESCPWCQGLLIPAS